MSDQTAEHVIKKSPFDAASSSENALQEEFCGNLEKAYRQTDELLKHGRAVRNPYPEMDKEYDAFLCTFKKHLEEPEKKKEAPLQPACTELEKKYEETQIRSEEQRKKGIMNVMSPFLYLDKEYEKDHCDFKKPWEKR